MRQMNLEPIKQSEEIQKEKEKYHILTHIYVTHIYGTKNLFAGQQWRKRQREQTYGHGEKAGEGEMVGESNMESYITICKIDSQGELAVYLRDLR